MHCWEGIDIFIIRHSVHDDLSMFTAALALCIGNINNSVFEVVVINRQSKYTHHIIIIIVH